MELRIINIIRPKLNIVMSGYRKDTLEKRIKLSISHGARPFKMIRKSDGVCIGEFLNQTEASRISGVGRSAISNVLAGISKSTKDFHIKRGNYGH